MKAFLIALAVMITFDAVAWHGAVRETLVHQAVIAATEFDDLDWSWG